MEIELSLQIFEKTLTYPIPRKSTHWTPGCCMRTDRRTDMTKLIVAFRIFANAPINVWEEGAE